MYDVDPSGGAPIADDGDKTTLQVKDDSGFSEGDRVKVYDQNGTTTPGNTGDQDYEETIVTGKTSGDLQVDLKNEYDTPGDVVVENVENEAIQKVTNRSTIGNDDATTLKIADPSNISVGNKVRISDGTNSEGRIVQAKGPNNDRIDVDLFNSYASTDNPTVQKVAEESSPTNGEGHFRIDDERQPKFQRSRRVYRGEPCQVRNWSGNNVA